MIPHPFSGVSKQARVLVTGGSGYLGQHIIADLLSIEGLVVAYTYHQHRLPASDGVQCFKVDLATGTGLEAVSIFKPDVIVNCAAISQPVVCEHDYVACTALNIPQHLVAAMEVLRTRDHIEALLVHMSTDQVYDGVSRAVWTEDCPTNPVNAYGRSKLEAEQYLATAWPGRTVSLRSSVIYGPSPPFAPVERPLFAQFIQGVLESGRETVFFTDEHRRFIFVQDICQIVRHIITRYMANKGRAAAAAAAATSAPKSIGPQPDQQGCPLAMLPHWVYNMGGPQRLSRYDMAMAVARHCGYSTQPVKPGPVSEVWRGYDSPPDVNTSMEQLLTDMPGIRLTPVAEAMQQIAPQGTCTSNNSSGNSSNSSPTDSSSVKGSLVSQKFLVADSSSSSSVASSSSSSSLYVDHLPRWSS